MTYELLITRQKCCGDILTLFQRHFQTRINCEKIEEARPGLYITKRLRRRLHWPENTASALCGPVGFSQASGTSD